MVNFCYSFSFNVERGTYVKMKLLCVFGTLLLFVGIKT